MASASGHLSFESVYAHEFADSSVISVPAGASIGPSQVCDANAAVRVPPRALFAQYAYVGLCFVDQSFQSCASLVSSVRRLCDVVNARGDLRESQSEHSLRDSASVASSSDSLTVGPAQAAGGSKFKLVNILRRRSKKKSPPSTETQRKNPGTFSNLAIIFVSLDFDMQSYCCSASQASGHYLLPLDCINLRSRLVRACNAARSVPTLSIIDTGTLKVICPNARRHMLHGGADSGSSSHNGSVAECLDRLDAFPWPCTKAEELLLSDGELVSPATGERHSLKQTMQPSESSGSKTIALLFAANWCPPCRNLVRGLTMAKRALPDHKLTVVFCSSDLNQGSYDKFAGTMPWLCFPFGDNRVKLLADCFNVTGIPSLVLLDGNLRLITVNGKEEFSACTDPLQEFPWMPRPVYELTEATMSLLREAPSVVLFSDGSKEDVEFARQLLRSVHADVGRWQRGECSGVGAAIAEEADGDEHSEQVNGNCDNGGGDGDHRPSTPTGVNNPDVRFFYGGADGICDELLQDLGLEEELTPLLVAIDAAAGVAHCCGSTLVSPEICSQFARRFMQGDSMVDMPARYFRPAALLRSSRLATIPKDVMQKAINAQSPRREQCQ